jgi:hypothetical protein
MSLEVWVERSILAADQHPSRPEDLIWGRGGAIAFHEPRVYEADGVTPVPVFWAQDGGGTPAGVDNPEPSTWVLMGIGLVCVVVKKLRKEVDTVRVVM